MPVGDMTDEELAVCADALTVLGASKAPEFMSGRSTFYKALDVVEAEIAVRTRQRAGASRKDRRAWATLASRPINRADRDEAIRYLVNERGFGVRQVARAIPALSRANKATTFSAAQVSRIARGITQHKEAS